MLKVQANLAQNKANKMVDKIQPYKEIQELNISAITVEFMDTPGLIVISLKH